MVISRISAIAAGARIKATSRVSMVERETDLASLPEADDLDEILIVRRPRQKRPGKDAIGAGRSIASRCSADVQDQLTRLKLGG